MRSIFLILNIFLTFLFLNCLASSSETEEIMVVATDASDLERDAAYSESAYDNERREYSDENESSSESNNN